jgi:hypothetical protein
VARGFPHRRDIGDVVSDRAKLAAARATLRSLFTLGEIFPHAEKLARKYFVQWRRPRFPPCVSISSGREDLYL